MVSPPRNRQYLLAGRPVGPVLREHFGFHETGVADLPEGGALVGNLLVSIDPAMRGWRVNRAQGHRCLFRQRRREIIGKQMVRIAE
jgi:NADPH-dependent curcumin reductase CurA